VPLVDQERLTLPEHLTSPSVFSGVRVTRTLVLYVCFVDLCILMSNNWDNIYIIDNKNYSACNRTRYCLNMSVKWRYLLVCPCNNWTLFFILTCSSPYSYKHINLHVSTLYIINLYFTNKSLAGVTSGAGTAYPCRAPEFTV
jgi:hypothetical protein